MGLPVMVIACSVFVWVGIIIYEDTDLAEFAGLFGFALFFVFGLGRAVLVVVGNSLYERPVYHMPWLLIYLGFSMLLFAGAYMDETSAY